MNTDILIKEHFSRNIGLLTEDDQQKLLEARVAVAGAGGVGSIHMLTLARLGVGKFSIADPDIYEAVNISRQYGAATSTLGEKKVEVMARMLKDINPYAEVAVLPEKIDEGNVQSFLEGANIFVDGIDFFEIDARRLLFKQARENGIYAITSAPLGFGATLQVFSPRGMSFDEYFGISNTMDSLEKIASFAAGLAPQPYHIQYIDMSKVSLKRKTGPAVSPACTLAASIVATEVVKILTGRGKVRAVPYYMQIDLMRGKFRIGCMRSGGKNLMHRLRRQLILRKARALST
jgi:molybdopterin/thiamine biosynthesis adenylyltransferase